MSRGARILLVDDLPQNLEILSGLLEPEGYALEWAQDGQQAVEMALKSPPDLILMDVSMPRMTGLEACRTLKGDERTRLVPIVLITALSAREDRIEGIAAGCDDFLAKPVDFEELLARTRSLLKQKVLVDELETAENVLVSLANALEAKDQYTRGHSERVATYAEALGGAVGLSRGDRKNLKRAGLLHDIGKIGIPLEYLHKPGPLTTTEYAEVKKHPAISYEICRPLRTMAPLLELIRGHHERLDGRGYPDGLRGDEVPLVLRCLTIADVYDALTTKRAYRPALPLDEALQIMRREASVGMWDAGLIDTFAEVVLKAGALR
ncbi:MAG TPA: HD domain-containing phosphohydrolase [Vicinamibacteria bacterium]